MAIWNLEHLALTIQVFGGINVVNLYGTKLCLKMFGAFFLAEILVKLEAGSLSLQPLWDKASFMVSVCISALGFFGLDVYLIR